MLTPAAFTWLTHRPDPNGISLWPLIPGGLQSDLADATLCAADTGGVVRIRVAGDAGSTGIRRRVSCCKQLEIDCTFIVEFRLATPGNERRSQEDDPRYR
jgi:hypothetical protein